MAAGQAMDLARVGEHVGHPAHVAISDGAFEQRRDIAGIDVERAVEPGQGGGEAVLAAGQLAAKHQRLGIVGVGGDGAVGRLERAGDVAGGAAEAADVGPDEAVVRGDGERAVERGAGLVIFAERHVGAAADPHRIGFVLGRGAGRFRERGAGIALKQFGVGEQMGELVGGHAGLAGADDLRFGGDAVAERELHPRLQHPRCLVVGIGLQRVQELDPGGADVPRLERGRARAR